jgi:hypothetical protein
LFFLAQTPHPRIDTVELQFLSKVISESADLVEAGACRPANAASPYGKNRRPALLI